LCQIQTSAAQNSGKAIAPPLVGHDLDQSQAALNLESHCDSRQPTAAGVRQAMQRPFWAVLIAVWLVPAAAAAAPLSPAAIFDRALATAATISGPGQHIDALQRIAESRAAFGDQPGAIATWNEAVRIVAEIGDPEVRGANLQWIVEGRAAAGDLSGALATLEGIEGSSARTQALIAIASAQAIAGDRSDAKTNLREALNEAKRLDPSAERDRVLHDIAIAQAEQVGDIDGALWTVEAVNATESVAEIRVRIAVAQKKSGADAAATASLQAALSAADAVADVNPRARLLSSFVVLLADAGLTRDAAMVAGRTLDLGYQGYDLDAALAALARAGDLDAALAVAKRAGAPTDIELLHSIARAHRDLGNPRAVASAAAVASEANAQIEQIADRNERDHYYSRRALYQARAESYDLNDYLTALSSAVDSLADAKPVMRSESDRILPRPTIVEVADAVAFAHAITDAETRLDTLARIATPLLLSGDSRALDLPIREALTTVGAEGWSDLLVIIAITQVAARDYAGAKATARRVKPQERLYTLVLVAWGEACADEVDVAKTTLADALVDARQADQQEIGAFIAVVQARLGDLEQALTTAEGISEATHRVDALIGIATGRLAPLLH
jgi:hypothetical protein